MTNSYLFISSVLFSTLVSLCYRNMMFYNMNLLLSITSMLNHGLTNNTIKKIDRIYAKIYVVYVCYFIKDLDFDHKLIKPLIYLGIFSGVVTVLFAIFIRKTYRKETYYSTIVHICSHFILMFLFYIIDSYIKQ